MSMDFDLWLSFFRAGLAAMAGKVSDESVIERADTLATRAAELVERRRMELTKATAGQAAPQVRHPTRVLVRLDETQAMYLDVGDWKLPALRAKFCVPKTHSLASLGPDGKEQVLSDESVTIRITGDERFVTRPIPTPPAVAPAAAPPAAAPLADAPAAPPAAPAVTP